MWWAYRQVTYKCLERVEVEKEFDSGYISKHKMSFLLLNRLCASAWKKGHQQSVAALVITSLSQPDTI